MPLPLNLSLFRQLTDSLPFGVYIAGTDRTIEYCNRAAEAITGYLGQETLGRRCGEEFLMHCHDTETATCNSLQCPLSYVTRNGLPVECRLFAQHKEGHRIPTIMRAIPLRNEQGAILAVALLFHNENSSPEDLSWIDETDSQLDPVLGIYSAATTEKQLRSALACPASPLAGFLIEIEHLAELARKHGTEMTRVAQRAVIHTITRLLNVPHYLGLWEESSLLVLIPECGRTAFSALRERLASVANSCAITWWGDRIDLRFVVADALSQPGDSLETFVDRLHRSSSPVGQVGGEL
jgi:PAS domain S-box-containing protein